MLAAVSRVLPRARWSCFLVKPETLLRWHRRLVAGSWTYPRRGLGRPRLDDDVQQLIVRLATENPHWGYQRIKGEQLRLGVRVSATAILATPRRHGLDPAPRRATTTWRKFLRRQAGGVVACDLLHRRHRLAAPAVRAVLHRAGHPPGAPGRGDRHPHWSLGHPAGRNLLLTLTEQGHRVRFLLRDRDAKFTRAFDDVFRAEHAEVLRTPVQAPNANAYAERWVRTVRTECLDWLLIVGRSHLDRISHLRPALRPASPAPGAPAGAARPSRTRNPHRGPSSTGAPA